MALLKPGNDATDAEQEALLAVRRAAEMRGRLRFRAGDSVGLSRIAG
jgi:hypothetical protein